MSTTSISRSIAEGETSRIELAKDLAAVFRSRPAAFEPRRLERLGSAGLACFLQHIGAAAVDPQPDESRSAVATGKGAKPPVHRAAGWAQLRRPERHYWLVGLFAGIRVGGAVAAAGLLLLLVTERGAPFIGRLLS